MTRFIIYYLLLLLTLTTGYLYYAAPIEVYASQPLKSKQRKKRVDLNGAIDKITSSILELAPHLDTATAKQYATLIYQECCTYKHDWRLIVAIMQVESSFREDATSYKGAIGLMQLMPDTAKYLLPKLGMSITAQVTNPELNIKLGVYYIDMLYDKFDNMETAIVAYNRGPSRVRREMKAGRYVTGYLDKVMECYNILKEG